MIQKKTRMWEMVPDLMPNTYVIEDQKWKDGKAGSVFCRWVPSPAIPPRTCEKVGPGPKIDKIDT